MNLAIGTLSTVFGLLVISHFVLFGRLKSYLKKSYPTEWQEYARSLPYKLFLFDKGVINMRFGYIVLFIQNRESLSHDTVLARRVKTIQWIHGIAAAIGILLIFTIIYTSRIRS